MQLLAVVKTRLALGKPCLLPGRLFLSTKGTVWCTFSSELGLTFSTSALASSSDMKISPSCFTCSPLCTRHNLFHNMTYSGCSMQRVLSCQQNL